MLAEARVAIRLLLEHHPLCSEFAGDRVRVGRMAVCSGCLAAAPAALVGLAAALVVILRGAAPLAVLVTGLVLGLPQATTYLHRGGRAWRAAVKALGGLGIGLLAGSALFLPRAWVALGSVLLLAAFAGLQAVRVKAILRTCDACPYRRDWASCPGFQAHASAMPPAPALPPAPASPPAAASWERPSSSQAP